MKNGKEESTNTFLSSSLQQSSSTGSSTGEETPVKEKVNQTISTIVPDEVHMAIEQNEPSTPDLSEEQKEIVSTTPSSGLNPEAIPFVAPTIIKIESTQSMSSGDESDDEHDSNETPITSGK